MAIKEGISGPHLQTAFLCEKVLNEKDGVISFIRVVDRFTVPKMSLPKGMQLPPGAVQPAVIQFNLVIGLKAGDVTAGTYKIRLALVRPSGSPDEPNEFEAFFNGSDDHGVAIIAPIGISDPEQGLHWFDVYFEERLLTRIPLRVLYQTVQLQLPPQS